ncbi:multidrug efflux pump membrane fusion protein MdtA [Hyphomicrobiales bacterium]|nr:multidrug efflux pump membrane fusion protein MdtA [Hyphomicrobiales bacterium]CAH1688817.1 multidrug efflux pump membrane fusion protein MdtA [Hyphomicrobiales bacterium]
MSSFRRPGSSRTVIVLATLGSVAIGTAVAFLTLPARSQSDVPTPPAQAAVPVTATRVIRRDVPLTLTGLGTVQASQTVNVRTRVDGTLQDVTFREGQHVKAGDVLARLDPRLAEAALAQARASKAKDAAQLRSAQADLSRSLALASKDFASKQQLDQQQATVDQLKATIDADQAAIDSAATNLDYMTITAPTSGRMGIRQADAGNVVHPSDILPIGVLATLKPVAVLFTLPEKNLFAMQAAMRAGPVPITATDESGAVLGTGRVTVIDNRIDPTTATLRLKAEFPNDDERLWPGAFVHVTATVSTLKNALTVPDAAVQRGPDGLYAWVVDGDGMAQMRPIETGATEGDLTVVASGLADGDEVVTAGQYRLRPRVHVAVSRPGDTPVAPRKGTSGQRVVTETMGVVSQDTSQGQSSPQGQGVSQNKDTP